MNSEIGIRLSVLGTHRWDGAPPHRAYLGITHSHQFEIEVTVTVEHHERQVEFHDLRDQLLCTLEDIYESDRTGFKFEGRSCEMIALDMFSELSLVYSGLAEVKVSEDGNCWAKVSL